MSAIRPVVMVTGANGFVGTALCTELILRGYDTIAASRYPAKHPQCTYFPVKTLDSHTDWRPELPAGGVVVHLAGRAHVLNDTASDPLALFRATNTDATANLARQAAAAGVKRFILASSVKVNGEGRDVPYTEDDDPQPTDPYGLSKAEAEDCVREVASGSGMEATILRFPLVYGPDVKANFLNLMSLIDRGWPLPFGGIMNSRSMLYVGNLTDAVIACMTSPRAANETFLLSDTADLSTSELALHIAQALGRPARFFSVPKRVIQIAGRCIGKEAELQRLLGSLTVDSRKFCRAVKWVPPHTPRSGIEHTASWFRSRTW